MPGMFGGRFIRRSRLIGFALRASALRGPRIHNLFRPAFPLE